MTRKRALLPKVAAVFVALSLLACQTSTTQVERAARAKVLENAPYTKILVVGVAPRKDEGRAFEKILVEELANHDTRASAMHKVVAAHVEADVKFGNRRVDLKERPQQGGLVDFFRHEYEEITSEPDANMKLTARIVSNVYDVKTGKRVYTLESATANAKTAEDIIVAESGAIALRLRKDDIIR